MIIKLLVKKDAVKNIKKCYLEVYMEYLINYIVNKNKDFIIVKVIIKLLNKKN